PFLGGPRHGLGLGREREQHGHLARHRTGSAPRLARGRAQSAVAPGTTGAPRADVVPVTAAAAGMRPPARRIPWSNVSAPEPSRPDAPPAPRAPGVVAFFSDGPIFASVVAILITLAGAISIPLLPVSQCPPIVPPTVNVSATYTGASADVVERTLTLPI